MGPNCLYTLGAGGPDGVLFLREKPTVWRADLRLSFAMRRAYLGPIVTAPWRRSVKMLRCANSGLAVFGRGSSEDKRWPLVFSLHAVLTQSLDPWRRWIRRCAGASPCCISILLVPFDAPRTND